MELVMNGVMLPAFFRSMTLLACCKGCRLCSLRIGDHQAPSRAHVSAASSWHLPLSPACLVTSQPPAIDISLCLPLLSPSPILPFLANHPSIRAGQTACIRGPSADTPRVRCLNLGQPTSLSAHTPYPSWRARWNVGGNILFIESYAPLSPHNMHTPPFHVYILSQHCPRHVAPLQTAVLSSHTKFI